MYLVLTRDTGRIMYITDSAEKDTNGFYILDDGLRIHESLCQVVYVDSIPQKVESEKWCYIDDEFVLNQDWVEPEAPGEEIDVDRILGILRGEIE